MFQIPKAEFRRFSRQQKSLCSKTNSACPFCTQGSERGSTVELEWLIAQKARLQELQFANELLLWERDTIIWELDRIFLKNRNKFVCPASCFEIYMSSKLYKCINNCQMFWTYPRAFEGALMPMKEKQSL